MEKEKINLNDLLVIETSTLTNDQMNSLGLLSRKYDEYTESISRSVKGMFNNYLEIAANLYNVKKDELYLIANYKNIYEYGEQFNIGKTTIKNLLNVAENYLEKDKKTGIAWGRLESDYKSYGFSQLVELTSLPDPSNLENINPEMSVREIRKNVAKEKLIDYYNNLISDDSDISIYKSYVKYIIERFPKFTFKSSNINGEYQSYHKIEFYDKNSLVLELRVEFGSHYQNYYQISIYNRLTYFYKIINNFVELQEVLDKLEKEYLESKIEREEQKKENELRKQEQIEIAKLSNLERFKLIFPKENYLELHLALDLINKHFDFVKDNFEYEFEYWNNELFIFDNENDKELSITIVNNALFSTISFRKGEEIIEINIIDYIDNILKEAMKNFVKE